MTREQQRKLRELKSALPKIIRAEIKKYKLKKKDYMIWAQKEELFFDLMLHISERNGHCYCTSVERIKPLWIDDLLWDILEMPENKEEPLSLRAIGAFAVMGSEIYKNETELLAWTYDELEAYAIWSIEHFHQSIQSGNIEQFYDCISSSGYHQELRIALSLVYNKKYEEAIRYLDPLGKGCLCNGSLWVNYAIIDYCKARRQNQR